MSTSTDSTPTNESSLAGSDDNPPLAGDADAATENGEVNLLPYDEITVAPRPEVNVLPAADQSEMFPIAPHAAAEARVWKNLRRPLDLLLQRQLTKPITSTQVKNLKLFWYDGIFAAGSDGLALAYIPLYAVALGATTQQVGWMASFGNLAGALALFPGARVLDMLGTRKPLVVWSYGIGYRGVYLILALLPFLFPSFMSGAGWVVPLIILLNCVRTFSGNFANPAWTAMIADLVPTFMRGRYFSLRNMLTGISTLVATALSGWIIQTLGDGSARGETDWALIGFQTVFLLAFIIGTAASITFARIKEPPPPPAAISKDAPRRPLREILGQSPALRGFIISAFIWNMSIQIAAPYFNVYMVTHLGGNEMIVGYTAAISGIFALVGQLVFGKLVDRKGSVWVFLVSGFPIVILPSIWSFYTNAWQVGWNNMFGGFFWAGYNLANFNLLLMLTPDDQRPRAVALYQTAVFSSSVIGPLIGGYVAENLDYTLIFWLSSLGRLIGLLSFCTLGMKAAFATERGQRAALTGT